MAVKETIQDSDMVAGTLTINSIPAKVLIHSEATKAFISRKFVQQVHCQTCLLENALTVETASQDRIIVNQICPHCQIEIVGHTFYAN